MTFIGRGAVAIWHDMAPEGREQFYAWHGQEHMPERVGIEGFNRGRRFIAIPGGNHADREFFNLYETRDENVVKGEAYKARLDDPTPWTLDTVKHFRKVARSLCRIVASLGAADGGIMATLRYSLPEAAHAAHEELLGQSVLPTLMALPGIAAVHAIAADLEASGYVNAEQRARGAANETPSHALIVEGWGDEAPFMAALDERLSAEALAGMGVDAPAALGFYRHQITTLKAS